MVPHGDRPPAPAPAVTTHHTSPATTATASSTTPPSLGLDEWQEWQTVRARGIKPKTFTDKPTFPLYIQLLRVELLCLVQWIWLLLGCVSMSFAYLSTCTVWFYQVNNRIVQDQYQKQPTGTSHMQKCENNVFHIQKCERHSNRNCILKLCLYFRTILWWENC